MKRILLIAAAIAIAGPVVAEELRIEPGEWQLDMTTEAIMVIDGKEMSIPAQENVSSHCVTPEDAVMTPEKYAESLAKTDGDCESTGYEQNGRQLTIKMSCDLQGSVLLGTTIVTVSPDGKSMNGTVNLDGDIAGMSMTSRSSVAHSYQGPCS